MDAPLRRSLLSRSEPKRAEARLQVFAALTIQRFIRCRGEGKAGGGKLAACLFGTPTPGCFFEPEVAVVPEKSEARRVRPSPERAPRQNGKTKEIADGPTPQQEADKRSRNASKERKATVEVCFRSEVSALGKEEPVDKTMLISDLRKPIDMLDGILDYTQVPSLGTRASLGLQEGEIEAVAELRRKQQLAEKKDPPSAEKDPVVGHSKSLPSAANAKAKDQGADRRRTLQCLEEVRDADASAERSRNAKQKWTAIQKKMKAISFLNHVMGNPDSIVLQEELMKMPMFQSCSLDFTRALSTCMDITMVQGGTDIVTAGSQVSRMYWLLRGTVAVHVDGQEVRRLKPNQCIGELMLLGLETEWSVTLRTVYKSTVVSVGRSTFETLLQSFPNEDAFFGNVTLGFDKAAAERHETNPCSLLNGAPSLCLQNLEKVLTKQIAWPGECLINEGESGDNMYILVQGSINITLGGRLIRREKRNKVGTSGSTHMQPELPHCFGELGLLGVQKVRTATITADSTCLVRVLHRVSYVSLVANTEQGDMLELRVSKLSSRYGGHDNKLSNCLSDVGMFREVGCSVEFLDFLGRNLEDRMFIQGQTIIDEDLADDRCMYIIIEGSVTVMKKGEEVAILTAGTVIGEIAALGLESRRSATVVAKETCYMQCLHQPVVVRGLELFPEDRHKILQVALARVTPDGSGNDSKDTTWALLLSDKTTTKEQRVDLFVDILRKSDLLEAAGIDFIKELAEVSSDRIYMPSDVIVEDGKRGASMFVMLSGEAGVYKNGAQVAVVGPGSICGELAMLGVSLMRTSTIQAHQICCMWEIAQDKAMPLLDKNPKARAHFTRIVLGHLQTSVCPLLLSLPLFCGLDNKLKTLLGLWCERRVYFPGQTIVKEGAAGNRLYIINLGRATLEKKGITIRTYDCASHFGSNIMMGDPVHKVYLGTLIALQTCHIVMITRQIFMQAVEKYPEGGAAKRLIETERQAAQELAEMIRRVSSKKLVWKRYGNLVARGENTLGDMPDNEKLMLCWKQWLIEAQARRNLRVKHEREREQARQEMNAWVRKKQERLDKVAERQEEMFRHEVEDEQAAVSPADIAAFCHSRAQGKVAQPPDPFFEKWPEPRPSPFYSLNMWDVLANAAAEEGRAAAPAAPASARQRRAAAGVLLPALLSARQARGRGEPQEVQLQPPTESPGGPPHPSVRHRAAAPRRTAEPPAATAAAEVAAPDCGNGKPKAKRRTLPSLSTTADLMMRKVVRSKHMLE